MRKWLEPDAFDTYYHNYMLSPDWKAKREEAFLFYGRKCQACEKTKTLHVHHADYEKLGYEPMSDLRILCGRCHRELHKKLKLKKITNLREWTNQFIRQKGIPSHKIPKTLYKQGTPIFKKKKSKLSTATYCVEDDYLLDSY